MQVAQSLPQLVEQARGGKFGPVVFAVSATSVHMYSIKAGGHCTSGLAGTRIWDVKRQTPC